MVNPMSRPFLLPVLFVFLLVLSTSIPARCELIYVTLQSSVVSFDLSSGSAATIAASKTTVASGLSEAMGLVFGGDGYLYVAEYSTNSVRKIDPSNGSKTTFASGFSNPRGITYNSAANNFYVANSGSPGSISQVTSGGAVSTYLTFGSNTSPYGLALDSSGALYSANNASYSVSKIVGGVASAFATFTPGSGTRGTAVDGDGNIYTSVGSGVQVTTPLGATSTFVNGGMGFPFGLAWSTAVNLYVASYTDNKIFAYDSAGTSLYSFSTGALSSDRPRYVAFDVEGSGFNQPFNAAVPEPGQVAASLLLLTGIGSYVWAKRRKVAKPAESSAA